MMKSCSVQASGHFRSDGGKDFVSMEQCMLYGGCIHHDNGILGSAAFKGAEYRKIRLLREAGYNAIRCSHNPMSEELMDACDTYGMLVMAELTDMWNYRKTEDDFSRTFADDWEKSAEMLVDVCFNHPSVVMYSVGNEIKNWAGQTEN